MVAEELGEEHAPPNMVIAFKQLRSLYGEPLIPLKLGTDFHGGHTDMTQIEVGKDQMMLTILPNHHQVPKQYQDSAAFFVVGHEFGHITSHPGKEAKYWREGMRELPVEHFQQPRWFNAISDILVNWTVITGSNIIIDAQRPFIQPQMLAGWKASQFLRRCGNMIKHDALLKAGRLTDNRYCPRGGIIGQYDNPDPNDPFKPSPDTPFWERYQGHGRGEQYYPPVSYAVAKNLDAKYKTVKVKKGSGGIRAGQSYVVEATKTFDDRIDSEEWEPMKELKINGTWIDARNCVGVCPHCGEEAPTIWERWWGFKSKEQIEREIASKGSWIHLLIQMFAFEWAAVYSTYIPYRGKTGKGAGKQFLMDIGPTMDKAMKGN